MISKRIILNLEKKDQDFEEFIQSAFNYDFLNIIFSPEKLSIVKKINRINTYCRKSHPNLKNLIINYSNIDKYYKPENFQGNLGFYIPLLDKSDELIITKLLNSEEADFIIVKAKDWKVIPFENLIAQSQNTNTELIAEVANIQEAELLLKTLEVGVDGILLEPKKVDDIVKLRNILRKDIQLELFPGIIKRIEHIAESDRVCVDTTSLLNPGEGMLVGSTATGFVLVHAEVFETEFVASRPFRVNAGDVSAYILVPSTHSSNDIIYQTKYLSELKGGDKVLVVNFEGKSRIVSVGRVKIETRPMLHLEVEVQIEGNKIKFNCICQNAETIRLVKPDGNPISVVDLKVGDRILAHPGPKATHFGTKINEKIIEK